ncbi:MAG: twin-arginine translocation signal domain-containing protein, partial [Nannocystaceae bacterium]
MARNQRGILNRRGFLQTTAVVTAGLPFGFLYSRRVSA